MSFHVSGNYIKKYLPLILTMCVFDCVLFFKDVDVNFLFVYHATVDGCWAVLGSFVFSSLFCVFLCSLSL